MLARLAPVDTWIFDLDNTLYPASADLFAQVDTRMTDYVARTLGLDRDAAFAAQKAWFLGHGTTLSGLMAEHRVDPHEFLAYVHDIDFGVLAHNALLAERIAALPGRKLVFTNGDAPYAGRVLERLGLGASFEAVHDIHAMGLMPKPHTSAYRGLCDAFALDPARSLFVDDMARNLAPAKAIGMPTGWVDNGSEPAGYPARDFIDFAIPDLADWLGTILEDQ